MIVVGASIGGTQALRVILRALPSSFVGTMAAVLHRHRDSDGGLIELLQQDCRVPVVEIVDKQPIDRRAVYVAPPDYHVMIDAGHFSLSVDEPVRFARPSIDVLFESAAATGYSNLIAVVLTGGGTDGANGAAAIAAAGGKVLVQSPREAVGADMPQSAIAKVPGAEVYDLAALANRLARLVSSEGSA